MNDEDFSHLFVNRIQEVLSECKNKHSWRSILLYLTSTRKVENLYENSEFLEVMNKIILEYINDDNFQIVIESLKILCLILKYSKKDKKDDILKLIQKEFFEHCSFYKRKKFLIFFEECVNIFSICFLKETSLIDLFIKSFSDNSIIICKSISILKLIYPLIADDNRLKFQIINKLENLRKSNIKDQELKRVIPIIILYRL